MNNSVNMNEMQASLQNQPQAQQPTSMNMNLQTAMSNMPLSGSMVNQANQYNIYINELKSQQKQPQQPQTNGQQYQPVDVGVARPVQPATSQQMNASMGNQSQPTTQHLPQFQMQQPPSIPSSSNNIQQQLQQGGYINQPQPIQIQPSMQQQQQQQQQLPQQFQQVQQTAVNTPKESKGHESRFRIIKTDKATPTSLLANEVQPMLNGGSGLVNGSGGLPSMAQPAMLNNNMNMVPGMNAGFVPALPPNANNYQRGRWHVVDFEYATPSGAEQAPEQTFNPAGFPQQSSQIPAHLVQQQQQPPQPQVQSTNFNSVMIDQSQGNAYNQNVGANQLVSNPASSNQNLGTNVAMLNTIPFTQIPGNEAMHAASGAGGTAPASLQMNGLVNPAVGVNTTTIPPVSHTNQNMPQQNSQQMQSTSAPNLEAIQQQQQPAVGNTQGGVLLNSNSSLLASQGLASGNIVGTAPASMINAGFGTNNAANLGGMMNEVSEGQSYNQAAMNKPQIANQAQSYSTDQSNAGASLQNPALQTSPREAASQLQNAGGQSQQSASNISSQQTPHSSTANALDQTASSLKDIILNTTTDAESVDSGIHSRINMAMDLVKSHLTNAVTEEIVHLKLQIKQLNEKCARLEQENILLKQHIPPETLLLIENRLTAPSLVGATSATSLVSTSSSTGHMLSSSMVSNPINAAGVNNSSNPNLISVSNGPLGLANSSSAVNLVPGEVSMDQRNSIPTADASISSQITSGASKSGTAMNIGLDASVLSNTISEQSFVYNNQSATSASNNVSQAPVNSMGMDMMGVVGGSSMTQPPASAIDPSAYNPSIIHDQNK